jgi:transcriptional regulator with XRE-family HTH domain
MSIMTETQAGSIPTWTVGDRLRKARQHAGLEQAEFAEEIAVSRGTVLNYENDRVKPRMIVLRAWSMRTGVPLHWLMDGESPQPVEAGGSGGLPRLDLNQRPSDYRSCEVTPLRKASGTSRARRVERRHGDELRAA